MNVKHNMCTNLVWGHRGLSPEEGVSKVKSDGQVEAAR